LLESWRSLTKRAGSVSQRYRSEDPDPLPDPYRTKMSWILNTASRYQIRSDVILCFLGFKSRGRVPGLRTLQGGSPAAWTRYTDIYLPRRLYRTRYRIDLLFPVSRYGTTYSMYYKGMASFCSLTIGMVCNLQCCGSATFWCRFGSGSVSCSGSSPKVRPSK
jgi:hypothetical protein